MCVLCVSDGLGVQRSVGKAISHFKAAAQAGQCDSWLYKLDSVYVVSL